MAKRAGTYKGEKRRKELSRLKKQEEKRQRRLIKKAGGKEDDEIMNPEDEVEESGSEKDNNVSKFCSPRRIFDVFLDIFFGRGHDGDMRKKRLFRGWVL